MEDSREQGLHLEVSDEVMEQLRKSDKDIEEGRVRPVEELLEEL